MSNIKYLIIIAILATLSACKKEQPKLSSTGTMSYQGNSYPISKIRIEHMGYSAGDKYVLRLTAYPTTYTITEKSSSGYGTVLNAYFTAEANDFTPGAFALAHIDTLPSTLTFYPNTADGSTDTTSVTIDNGTLDVDTFDTLLYPDFLSYSLRLNAGADSVVGSYLGTHTHNFSIDQPAWGVITFDTLNYFLADPTITEWGALFSDANYYEITFYSSDARFTDKGAINQGLQLVLGIVTDTDSPLAPGTYPVTDNYTTTHSTLFGHKIRSTAWGSYWQILNKGSVAGKANILNGETIIDDFTDGNISLTTSLTDQLGNSVIVKKNEE